MFRSYLFTSDGKMGLYWIPSFAVEIGVELKFVMRTLLEPEGTAMESTCVNPAGVAAFGEGCARNDVRNYQKRSCQRGFEMILTRASLELCIAAASPLCGAKRLRIPLLGDFTAGVLQLWFPPLSLLTDASVRSGGRVCNRSRVCI